MPPLNLPVIFSRALMSPGSLLSERRLFLDNFRKIRRSVVPGGEAFAVLEELLGHRMTRND